METGGQQRITRRTSRTAKDDRSGIQRAGSEISKLAARRLRDDGPPPPPSKVLEQTIRWSTSSEILFTPQMVETKETRRSVVSPRDLQDEEYLGDLPTEQKPRPILLEADNLDGTETDKKSLAVESSDGRETDGTEDRKSEEIGKASGAENKMLKEQQERVMQRLRASGEDRI